MYENEIITRIIFVDQHNNVLLETTDIETLKSYLPIDKNIKLPINEKITIDNIEYIIQSTVVGVTAFPNYIPKFPQGKSYPYSLTVIVYMSKK